MRWATVIRMPSRASIVIPAFNEETRIRGLLDTLSDPSIADLYDVYVICNGCSDRTRQVAEEYLGVTVVEIADVGKYLALNEGDRLAGDVFPRLYCDADIRLSPDSITALVDVLTSDEVVVAAPEVRYDAMESKWMVKMFFRGAENPVIAEWNNGLLAGRGLYGTSRAARRRFEIFPVLYADDLFFDSHFGPTEKIVLRGAVALLWVPVNLRQLIKGETRVAEGNRQYRAAEHIEVGGTDHASVHRDRLERSMRVRATAIWTRRRELHDDVLPFLIYFGIRTATNTILTVKRRRRRQIYWR
jgi:glycosyltransferase involved in cell wall biosynthesis